MIFYRIAKIEDASQIADVHISCFSDYFISSLGKELVRKYYVEFIKENDLFVLALDNNAVVGFCMGYIINQTRAKSNFLKNNRIKLIGTIALKCVTFDRRAISKCMSCAKDMLRKRRNTIEKHGGDLLSICVLDKYRGKGIAQELMFYFENKLRDNNLVDYWLCVYKTNECAIKFYKKHGMKIEFEDEERYLFHKRFE